MKSVYSIIFILVFAEFTFAQVFMENNLEDGINYVVEFINSEEFLKLKSVENDLTLIDSIYLRAKKFKNDNIEETLLTLTFATLPFNVMPLKIPYIGIVLNVKLPSGAPNLVKNKIKNLPKNIFEDSPNSNFGDKDKTAHFFGNAYFSYSVTLFNLSKFLSIFVELFEDAFKIEGSIDNRDFIANNLGYQFGKDLIGNSKILPSEILKKYPLFTKYFEEENEQSFNN